MSRAPRRSRWWRAPVHVAVAVLLAGGAWAAPGDDPVEPVQQRLDALLAAGPATALVVGLRDREGTRFVVAGHDAGDGLPPDPDTRFQAGSITKVLNGLLLARLADAGRVGIDQPIGSLWPAEPALSAETAAITLEDLAAHRSGLPRLGLRGSAASARDSSDPYRDATFEELADTVAALPGVWIDQQRGRTLYSNLGHALLGQLLARALDLDYAQAVAAHVFAPLGLPAPAIDTAAGARMARGHDATGPVQAWRFDAYAPTAAWHASARELMALADALLDDPPDWAREAMRPRGGGARIGLGWHLARAGDRELVWHNGITAGFRSHLVLEPASGRAVVVLANGPVDVDALARALLLQD